MANSAFQKSNVPTPVSIANGGTGATTLAGAGIVSGPASATDNAIVRYDATTGKLVQDGALLVDDLTGGFVTVNPVTTAGTATSLKLVSGAGGTTNNGGDVQIYGAAGGATSGNGGPITLRAGNGTAGNGNGGNVQFIPGAKNGSGVDGQIIFYNSAATFAAYLDTTLIASSSKTFTFPNTSGTFALTSQISTAPTALTLIPQSAIAASGDGGAPVFSTVATDTVMRIGQIIVPFKITANKISIYVSSTNTSGTFDLTLYSEDGQTRLFSVTTATLSGSVTTFTTALSAVVINPGIYWIAINPNSTASLGFAFWSTTSHPFGTATTGIALGVASEPIMQGSLSITAGTPPATITPTSITYTDNSVLIIRLDN